MTLSWFQTKYQLADHTVMFDEASMSLRWFVLPSEAADCLQGKQSQNASLSQKASVLPFCPPNLREHIGLPAFAEKYSEEEVTVNDMLQATRVTSEVENVCKHSSISGANKGDEINENERKDVQLFANNKIENLIDKNKTKEVFEESFSEGMQSCITSGFGSSYEQHELTSLSVGNETNEAHNLEIIINEKSLDICSKKVNESSVSQEDANIEIVSCSESVVKLPVAGSKHLDSCSDEIVACDKEEFENSDIGRKRHAEGSVTNQVCEMAVTRTKDETVSNGADNGENRKESSKTDGGKKKSKKKGNIWFPPPKAIFTPFLKVSFCMVISHRFPAYKNPGVVPSCSS